MFTNRISDLTGGPGFLHVSGTLSKCGQRGLWVKRYMSMTTHQFTYYSRAGESFPLGFMDTHDILLVKEVEKNRRKFDVFANGQVLKLMAPNVEEAETWVKTIRAIIDAVKHSKFALSKINQMGGRRNMVIPKWKVEFFNDEKGNSKPIDASSETIGSISGPGSGLLKAIFTRPRLLKKLLVHFDDDLKLMKLIATILLKYEKPQRDVEQLIKANDGMDDGDLDGKSHHEPAPLNMKPIFTQKKYDKITKKHRRSHTNAFKLTSTAALTSRAVSQTKSNPFLPLVNHSEGGKDAESVSRASRTKKSVTNFWFYEDAKKETKSLSSLSEAIEDPEVIPLFKTYLKALYQDENIFFLCDARNFEKGIKEDGQKLDSEAISQEGWRIFDLYIKLDADMSVDPTERERRKIRQVLSSDEPQKAFEPVLSRIHELVEEQFSEYKESKFYKRISRSRGPIDERELSQKLEQGEVKGSAMVWKDGTKIDLWKKAGAVPVFKDALFDKEHNGELTPEETRFIFNWIVSSKDGVLDLAAEGVSSPMQSLRNVSYRVFLLVMRATMGYDDADVTMLSASFAQFIRHCRVLRSRQVPICQVMEDHSCLMAMMYNEVNKFDSDFDSEALSLKPSRKIWNHCLWPAVFDNLHHSNIYPRIKCLQDAYYHILTNRVSAKALLQVHNWQAWLLPLVFDIPSKHQSVSLSKMKTYVIATIVQLLWTCVEQYDFPTFAKELRQTIALTLSISREVSGHLVADILKSTASRFHTDCLKWIKMDATEQSNRYKCLYHMIRLLLSLALSTSGRSFGAHDGLRTHKILPKEFQEKHLREAKKKVQPGQPGMTNLSGATDPIGSENNSMTERRDSASSRRTSYSRGPRLSSAGRMKRSNTSREDGKSEICNDQQLIFMLKVYYHSQELLMRTRHEQPDYNETGSLNLNQFVSDEKVGLGFGEDDGELGKKAYVTNAGDIKRLYLRRFDELKASIEKFGDSDHICACTNYKSAIKLQTFTSPWQKSLRGYVDALCKLQMMLLALKQQDQQIAARQNGQVENPIDPKTKKIRNETLGLLSFVNDTVGFLDLMDKKLWRLLTIDQVKDLVHHFVDAPDTIRRRKVFHGWEKEKKKNQAKQTKELEKQLKEEEERRRKTSTILLIGPGQSGKSTVFKQLTILHGKGFSESKKRQFRKQIYANIVGAMRNLIYHANKAARKEDESLVEMSDELGFMHELLGFLEYSSQNTDAKDMVDHIKCLNEIHGLGGRYRAFLLEAATDEAKLKKALRVKKQIKHLKAKCSKYAQVKVPQYREQFYASFNISSDNKKYVQVISESPYKDIDMTPQLKTAIKALWRDKAIRNIYRRRQRFKTSQLDDSAVYMLQNIERILPAGESQSYLPSKDDIVHCRQRTLGIVEGEFKIKQQYFKIVDVAGQRGARSKWIPLFECANACLFVCSLAGYNRYLLEDKDRLRIHEAIQLFDDIVNQRALSRVPIIVFLNKADLFEREIKTVSLQHAFPEYSGPPEDFEESVNFVKHRFHKCVQDPNRQIYMHTTCATDTKQVAKILDSVTNIVVKQQLAAANLI